MVWRRAVALAVIGLLALGLVYIGWSGHSRPAVPDGAHAGDLALEPCAYETDGGSRAADCGTLVVPENRRDPDSRLIALPVVRVRATAGPAAEPVFRLVGGPGQSNMDFPEAGWISGGRDVVLVGYRGVDGSVRLDCPEVTGALRRSADFTSAATAERFAAALTDCRQRLTGDGVDLDGYSLPQRVDDLQAAREALGYGRIDLLSQSAGTRTAMIYSWRYPEALHRSVMIGANPPGHFVWDPEITDEQIRYYAGLCAADEGCAARTPDLAAELRATVADAPDRWGPLRVKTGTVRAATMWGLHESTGAAAPLNGPTTFDAWLSAAEGDPSGLWALGVLADLVFPESFVWGESAATVSIDAPAVEAYYAGGGDPGTILGNAATDFIWARGQMAEAWPPSPDHADYQRVRPSDVETLVIGGTVDFTAPPTVATAELMPALPNGHQVVLAELGHTADFWGNQPAAGKRLLNTFYDRGVVDRSGYTTQPVDFEVGTSMPAVARVVLAVLAGGALLALALLGGMALWVWRRGGFGVVASVLLRSLAAAVAGLGGWFLAILVAAAVWPGLFASGGLAMVASGLAVGLCVYLAWLRRGVRPGLRYGALGAAVAWGLAGAWLGAHAVAGLAGALAGILGAVLAANLAVLALDVARTARSRDRSSPDVVLATSREL
ncbi:alpha/beta hydrolase [Phytohabitans sp. ZYX-F-186]|uniref:Alpha/beta hydrolase n=1 Tax=Phytohabitans maris TaxID=3071409 RepID=A0ABU0ZT57_9ACTN|nr:alpha/beta hydrolase [Phytohabitans sp. ZYX-F-186]MDQ7909489.1 alpha/beta hydrolase [Phytohabitans sp. ZYX-F-186]